jgi:hypothetical protein
MDQAAIRQHLIRQLSTQITSLQQQLADIEAARNEETKSSAGDKYETSREMMQQAADQVQNQLDRTNDMLQYLKRLPQPEAMDHIQEGHLVTTNRAIYFLSVPFGKIKGLPETVYALSVASPLGRLLLGKSKGQAVTFNRRNILIEEVV